MHGDGEGIRISENFHSFQSEHSAFILLRLTTSFSLFQVNKGPVDYVTHEARYSLSEEKLIRQQVKL